MGEPLQLTALSSSDHGSNLDVFKGSSKYNELVDSRHGQMKSKQTRKIVYSVVLLILVMCVCIGTTILTVYLHGDKTESTVGRNISLLADELNQLKAHMTQAQSFLLRQIDEFNETLNAGNNGTHGRKGSLGNKGSKGEKGSKGQIGTIGIKGEIGEKGKIGDRGPKGERVYIGNKGPDGNKGAVGDKGPIGDEGPVGNRGPVGNTGRDGNKGAKGQTGDTGVTGGIGSTGDKGPIGDKGSAGDKGVVGDKGHIGYKGIKGGKGQIGDKGVIGNKGPGGDKGEMGDRGSQGIKGVKGKKGENGQTDTGYFEYVIMFIEPYSTSTTPNLFIISEERGNVDITNSSANQSISEGLNAITLRKSIFLKDGIQNKAVHIKSTVPIVVYGFGRAYDTSEGFLAIPTKQLSQKYVIPSFTVWKKRSLSKSLIGVVSIYTGTLVKIKLKTKSGSVTYIDKTYKNGDVIQVQMSAFESVQLSHNIDLSGSIVTSSHPVAVISGNKCNSVTHAPCNHFSEMVLPENQLDISYIVPVIEDRPQSSVRILCPNKASVDITTDKEQLHADLNEGEFFDFNHWNSSYITSKGDVLVTMFPHELKRSKGDSYMMTVIGQHQYRSDYHFPVPNNFTSYVSITVIGNKTEGFEMDGTQINPVKVSKISFQMKTYTTFSYSISSGSHKIRHLSGVKFGLWVYGSKWHDGYGYPAGITYK